MGTKKLTVIATSEASLESIQNSVISVVNQRRAKDQENNYIGDVFAVQHKTQFYVVDDDFIATVKSDGNVLKTDYITSTKLGEELAKIPSSGTVTLDEDKINELIDSKISTLNLESKANVSDVYTKSQVDEKVATISSGGSVNLDGYVREESLTNLATKDEVNAKLDSSTYTTDKATFATKTEIESKANKDEVYSKTEIDTKIEAIPTTNVDLSSYTTTEQLNLALTAKADKVMVDGLITKIEVNEEIAKLATKDELNPINEKIVVIEESIEGLASKDEITGLASKDEIVVLATKDELTPINDKLVEIEALIPNFATSGDLMGFANMDDVRLELAAKADVSVVETLATKAELGEYALKSEVPTAVEIDEEQVARAVRESSKIQELSSAVANLSSNLQGATYPQVAATMKYLGYDLPKTLAAYENFNAFGDDRLSGDTTITLTPIEYDGSYGQAWERVAIFNEADEMLVAKYATVSSDGLSIEAVFSKDSYANHPKGDSWEVIPDDYELLDGEVRASITLAAANYYGNQYSSRMLNHNATSYTESFLAVEHNTKPWSFTFYDYKPSKFSVRNGTETYGGYGHMTKYNLKLQIGDWSKEFVYENSKAVNDIVVDFKDLALGSDEKLIELAKAWNIPVSSYNFYDDVLVAKGVLLSSGLSGQNENFKTNQSAITLSTTKDGIEVSANLDDLQEYPSSNEAQGSGKWIGIGIDTGKPSILGVSVDDYELQQIDIDEATAVGLSEGSFVFWFKAEQNYTRELVLRSGELERSVSIVFNQVDKEINPDDSQKVEPENTQGESVNNQNLSDIIVID